MKAMKIIAFYLPQYHHIKENDKWWGPGFTEWTNLKQAKPLFEGHNQPRIPLDCRYYDLTDVKMMEWQVKLAREYGIYGFCMYHYWFQGKKLLHRPMELWLENQHLQLQFCISWANENWTRSWDVHSRNDILISQNYGDEEDWIAHFEYLYPFFKDDRYIKVNGKPLFVIYRPELMNCRRDMLLLWEKMIKERGFPGIAYASQQGYYNIQKDQDGELFDFQIEYQPAMVRAVLEKRVIIKNGVKCVDYDEAWRTVLNFQPMHERSIPGAFVNWDNTPRKKENGVVFFGGNPIKFKKYLGLQSWRAQNIYKKDMLFLFAWNEWTEGGYLEPDEEYGYDYLRGIKDVVRMELFI